MNLNTISLPWYGKANKKAPPFLPPSNPQEKKEDPSSLHDRTSHWLHGNSIPKFGWHYFWPALIALPKNTLPIGEVVATTTTK
jgi:hypothetical protein